MMHTVKKFLCMSIAVMVIAAAAFVVPAAAVSYEGGGTKSNPYLVKTAEQLQGMADRPSAHYKLANTIDLSSIADFEPIGYLAKPFTGSFVCDLNADGTPKYVIKNLKVTVIGKEGYTDYIEKNSHWECGLFGATKGATLTGIAVLNVTLKNTVVGLNIMNLDYSINPGVDEQAAAGLVAIAEDTVITSCVTTGNIVDSKNNHCGGIVGHSNGNVTIDKCASSVNIQSTGLWCHGGLIGSSLAGDKITNSYATGDLTKAAISKDFTTAGFAGQSAAVIENCYATGAVNAGGSSFIGRLDGGSIKNSYSASKVQGQGAPAAATTTSGCYILNTAGCKQANFQPVSAAELKTKFQSIAGWDTSGELPTLTGAMKFPDPAKYTPQAVTTTPDSNNSSNAGNNSQGGTQTPDADSTVSEQPQQSLSEEDFKFLEEIKRPDDITVEQAYKIVELQAALIEMTADEREAYSKYMPLVNQWYQSAMLMVVRDFTEQVEALPDPNEVKADDAEKINALYAQYEAFPEDVSSALSEKTVTRLEECHEKAASAGNETVTTGEIKAEMTTGERVLVIVLLSLSVLALIGAGVMIYLNVRLTGKSKATIGGDIFSESDQKTHTV